MGRYEGLVTGAARYAADVPADHVAHLVFVESSHAHATIRAVDVAEAAAMPGVLGVYTAADLDLVPIWEIHLVPDLFAQPPLAHGVVRYVGERMVAIAATSMTAAVDAAAAVVVDYEPLPPVAEPAGATSARSPVLFAAHGSNVALTWDSGPTTFVPSPSDVEVSGTVDMPRVAVAPLEGLAILAVPGQRPRLTLHVSTQSPEATRIQTARSLGISPDDIRVLTPRVGGAFGGKALGGIAAYVVAAAVALRLGRPVRFVEGRSANLVGMHGRGVHLAYRVHAGHDGAIRHVDVEERCDAGAYPQTNSVEPGKTMMMLCGPYRVPAVRFRAQSVVTNRAPSGAYRGPGRSEAAAVLERAMDQLALRLAVDPVAVRRRNLLAADELPATSVAGAHYDETDHHAVLARLMEIAGYDGLRAEQERRRRCGGRVQLGIGIATVVDSTAWFARDEEARVLVTDEGRVRVVVATASAGQEHGAAFASIVAGVLPVPEAEIEVVEGDTDAMSGAGTSGSRSLQLAGTAVRRAAVTVLDAMRRVAAEALEAGSDDVVAAGATFHVRGVPARALGFAEVAARADRASLDARCVFEQATATYPAGAHLSVVEIDTESGDVRPVRHVAVTDCGKVLDPPGAAGQVIGASAQGIAQALYEQAVYDDDGTPRTSSLADYLVPAASELPAIEVDFVEGHAAANDLGAKGVGEIGMVAAPVAVWNAVLDGLAPFGVDHVDLPCTPERVWRALARRGAVC
jgi:aerobic carbon-monoxide dehydrogenase large subunit